MDPSANKDDIIDAGEHPMVSITKVTMKEKTTDEKSFADYSKKLGEKSLSNLSHMDPPQMLLQNTQKGSTHCAKLVRK